MKSNNNALWVLCAATLLGPGIVLADGGGIHGPDLAPQSISLGDDHGVTPEIRISAPAVCSYLGSRSRGKIPLVNRVGVQVFPRAGESVPQVDKTPHAFPSQARNPHDPTSYFVETWVEDHSQEGAWWGPRWDNENSNAYLNPSYLYPGKIIGTRKLEPNSFYRNRIFKFRIEDNRFDLSETTWFENVVKKSAGNLIVPGKSRLSGIALKLPTGYSLPKIVGDEKAVVTPGAALPPYFQKEADKFTRTLTHARIEWNGQLGLVHLVSVSDPLERPTPAVVDLDSYVDCLKGEYQYAVEHGVSKDWESEE